MQSSLPNKLEQKHSQEAPSERVELARRLHDGLAQELVALGYSLDSIIARDDLASNLRSELRTLRLKLIEINNSFRDEIYLLRQLHFSDLSNEIKKLFGEGEVEISLPEFPLSSEIEDALVRALSEIVRNSARHSGSKTFKISHQIEGDRLVIQTFDYGKAEIAMRERSFGLASISEELAKIGAEVFLERDKGGASYQIRVSIN